MFSIYPTRRNVNISTTVEITALSHKQEKWHLLGSEEIHQAKGK